MIIYAVTRGPGRLDEVSLHASEQLAQARCHKARGACTTSQDAEAIEVVPVRLEEYGAAASLRRIADRIRVIRDATSVQIELDGQPLPWMTGPAWHVELGHRSQPGVTVTLLGKRVDVIHAVGTLSPAELAALLGRP